MLAQMVNTLRQPGLEMTHTATSSPDSNADLVALTQQVGLGDAASLQRGPSEDGSQFGEPAAGAWTEVCLPPAVHLLARHTTLPVFHETFFAGGLCEGHLVACMSRMPVNLPPCCAA